MSWRSVLRTPFVLDPRSLAVARILTGLAMIVDLISRSFEFRLHYTSAGILPLEAVAELGGNQFPGLYMLSDQAYLVAFFFIIHGCFAALLSLGYRTKWITPICFFLAHSLKTRNFLVNNGGDAVLLTVLFWAMFVPWGKVWSLDSLSSRRHEESPCQPILSTGTVALIGQAIMLYWCSVYHKMEPTWLNGETVYYAFHSDFYSRPISNHLLPYPELLTAFTYGALGWEILGPLLLFVPNKRVRVFTCLGFMALHFGFGVFLRVGIFMWTPMVYFVALLPGECWGWLERRGKRARKWGKRLQGWLRPPAPHPYKLGLEAKMLIMVVFFHGLAQSLENHVTKTEVVPQALKGFEVYTLQQRWSVFVKLGDLLDGWVQVPAQLSDGTWVDLWHGRDPLTWDKPLVVSEAHGHFRWPTPLVLIVTKPHLHPWFTKALVEDWNRTHPERTVRDARLTLVEEYTKPNYGDSPPRARALYQWKMPLAEVGETSAEGGLTGAMSSSPSRGGQGSTGPPPAKGLEDSTQ